MLVLSRKKTQRIMIGDDITITILGTRSGSVQLGIEAPESVKIMREELIEEIPAGSRAAQGGVSAPQERQDAGAGLADTTPEATT